MPELPEIETIKLQLQKVLVGEKLTNIQILNSKVVKGNINELIGQKLIGAERKGKVLLLDFGNGKKLGFHFKMTGQLIYGDNGRRIVGGHPTKDFTGELPGKHTRVVFVFDEGTLYFNDQRMFGWIEINPKFVDKLGPEPFNINASEFRNLISKSKRPIKLVLMDQTVISGIGNIYANDACWESGIRPDTGCSQLSEKQLNKLFKAVIKVLKEGIKYGGATAADDKYINLEGMGGHYQDHFRVYDRAGKLCLRSDGGTVKKIALGGRGTYYCPRCQK